MLVTRNKLRLCSGYDSKLISVVSLLPICCSKIHLNLDRLGYIYESNRTVMMILNYIGHFDIETKYEVCTRLKHQNFINKLARKIDMASW